MRRFRDRQPAGLFRGGELARLMTMIVMLGVLAMMFRRARDVDTWRFLTGEPAKVGADAGQSHGPLKPRARSRSAAHPADTIVVNAPESDVELALPVGKNFPPPSKISPTPSDTLAASPLPDETAPAEESVSKSAAPKIAAAGNSSRPDESATALALAPQPTAAEPDASPAESEDNASSQTAAEQDSSAQSTAAAAEPVPDAEPTAAQAQAGKPQSSKSAEPGAADGNPSAPIGASRDSAAKDDAQAADKPEDTASPAKPAGTSLYRPHLPANPDNVLDPNAVPAKPEIEPAPIDENEEEREGFDHECEAISDRTPISKEEMFAYWRLLRWAQAQTTDEMLKRARSGVRYGDLLEHPEDFRGELLKVKLHIVRVREEEAPPDIPIKLHHYYQAVGWNDASQSWFYHCIFEDLPDGMPIGDRVYEEGTFVGYFFKTLVYLDGKGTKTKSPVLIGRMIYHPSPSIARNPDEWMWSWAIGGVLLVLFVLRWGWRLYRPRKVSANGKDLLRRPGLNEAGEPAVPIEDWLEQAESQAPAAEIKTPDNHDSNGSAHGNGLPLHRDHGLDWTEDRER